jgi:hydrogenase maturation protease
MTPEAHGSRSPVTIIGLGNELLSDDGVGIHVLRGLKERLSDRDIIFEDSIESAGRCIIIDAIISGEHRPGTVMRFVQSADDAPRPLSSSHQIDLGQVLALARMMGADVPEIVTVYAIEAKDITTFRESCTEDVAVAIPRLVEAICRDLEVGAPVSSSPSWQCNQEAASG